jgi:putative addiction module component (TIGR02574 family)
MMGELSEKVTKDALSLPVDLRLELGELLLKSLNVSTKSEIDAAWAKEAEHRMDQIDKGAVKTFSAKEVFERIRQELEG